MAQYMSRECTMAVNRQNMEQITALYKANPACGPYMLHLAADNGYLEGVQLLLDEGMHPDSTYSYARTPLHLAVSKGHEAIVGLLIARNANANAQDTLGKTPLHIAAAQDNIDVVEYLLDQAHAHAGIKDNLGNTPEDCAKVFAMKETLFCALQGQNAAAVAALGELAAPSGTVDDF